MPAYLITVNLKRKDTPVVGVREITESWIERAWQIMEAKARDAYKEDFESFDLVMISKRSETYKTWLAKKNKKIESATKFLPDIDDMPQINRSNIEINSYQAKYRNKSNGSSLDIFEGNVR